MIEPAEDTFSPRQPIFNKRSTYHHHTYPQHRRASYAPAAEYMYIPSAEWDALAARERTLHDANEAFARENETLKRALHESNMSLSHLPSLQSQLDQLTEANAQLRADHDDTINRANKAFHDVKKLRAQTDQLRAERDGFEANVRQLQRELERTREKLLLLQQQCANDNHHKCRLKNEELRRAADEWKTRVKDTDTKYDEVMRKNSQIKTLLKDQEDTLATYEKILRRHGHIR